MGPIETTFDVTDGVGTGERLVQTAWLFLPDPGTPLRAAMVCLAGGTYDKHYWHLEVDGHRGYSFGQHLASSGFVVLAADHLGVGGSSDPHASGTVGLELLARGDAEVARQLRQRVRSGTLHESLRPADLPVVGVGHSMGSCLTTIVQASCLVYDAVVLLGYGVHIANVGVAVEEADLDVAIRQNYEAIREIAVAEEGSTSWIVPRAPLRGLFYSDDVPDAVIDADDAQVSRLPAQANAEVITPGFVKRFAAQVDVPVFLGFGGAGDVTNDPYLESSNYRKSTDITLYVVDGSAHCHNFAGRRAELWDRIAAWIPTVAAPTMLSTVKGMK